MTTVTLSVASREDVTRRALRFRSPDGSPFQIPGYPATYDCDTPAGCRGWGSFSLYSDRVVVVDNDFNTDVTAYDARTGVPTKLCPGLVMAYVVTETGKAACGQFHGGDPSHPNDIVSEGVVIDYDARGNLVGIDIDNASTKVDMRILKLSNLPGKVETVAA